MDPRTSRRAHGRTAEAVASYERSAAAYRALPRPYHAARTAEATARSTLSLGEDIAPAVTWLTDCATAFDALGASWSAARTRADLRRRRPAAERWPPGRPGYGDMLSPREAEVAELAADGMSNKEIATTLHLSPPTVEQHVARALQETGAPSRKKLVQALAADSD
ncbi:response regulator transcription factor [Streptomyces sp. NPDC004266]|uniref:helix-turn-helix transcriptional regulator n=1 Tax=Streptomyces sp. NPDC004266 TaxID=3364693 RepID=UPI0036AE58A9